MMRKPLFPVLAGALAALAILASCGQDAGRPNVLLVSLDTVRPDHMGCYGYEQIETPVVDGLADRGVLFEDCVTPIPLTLPAHSSILTGLYPISHGVRDNGSFALAGDFTTIAEILKGEGYSTGAFIGAFVLDSRFGLDQGFDVYHDNMAAGRKATGFGYEERPAEDVNRDATAWLDTVPEPFFGFVHYYDPHAPFEPLPPYDSLYAGRPYDGEIAYTDAALGRLLERLERRGISENTLIVVVSDHGEGLGEHGEVAHGVLLYDTTVRVVLVMRLPGDHPAARERSLPLRISQPVRLIDVAPTILEALGMEAGGIDGRSLLPLVRGETLSPEFSYLETFYPYFAYNWSPLRGVRFGEWKYILAPEEEIYNLESDPGEMRNLIGREAERAEELKANLLTIAAREGQVTAPAVKMSAEEMGKLQALGYVGSARPTVPEDIEPRGPDPKHMIRRLDALMGPGESAFDRGDYETAYRNFKELTRIDPGNPDAFVHLGKTLLFMDRLDEAAEAYRRATQLDSTNSTAFFQLGNVYRMKGSPDRALAAYEQALDILPGTPEALANIGGILLDKGLADSAIVVLQQALAVDPDHESTLINLGMAHSAGENHAQALDAFRRVLKTDPRNVKALVNCSMALIRLGDSEGAADYLERACELDPEDPSILLNLGGAYRSMGRNEEAAGAYEAALELDPQDVYALFGLAATRAAEGDRESAREILLRIVGLQPDFEPARRALESLGG
jgi:arylsulfatase A-like enzyme/Flp pilus assembly protein TadD